MSKRGLALLVLVAGVGRVAPVWAESATERRLRLLEEQLQAAQEEIQRLRREVRENRTMTEKAEVDAKDAQKVQEETVKKLVPEWLKRITLFGDVRTRFEGFYNQPTEDGELVTARNRLRVRARVGLRAAMTDEIAATVRLASGNPDDPISTNVTLDDEFTPKDINLDWAYLTFTPGTTFGIRPGLVTIGGGKFPNPLFRPTEMVWDDDLSPEGLWQTVALLGQPAGALQQFKLNLIEWTFAEDSNGPDGWVFGGQLNPSLRVGPADVDLGVGQYGYLNVDGIAQALNTNSSLKNTNLVFTETMDGETEIAGYDSTFNLTNVSANATFANAVGAMPLRLFGEFVHNWGAVDDASDGVIAGVKLGQTKLRGDWAVTALYEYLEQEAALSAFTWSDFGLGGTNNSGPMLALDYQLLDPLTLTARNYFVNFIDRPAGMTNPTLFRLQLDAVVKF